MQFPMKINFHVHINDEYSVREISIHGGLTVLLGPNGAGKTHLLRGLKGALQGVTGKRARFLSAGRISPIENYRSDYDGHRGGAIPYDEANHGSKSDAKRRHSIETINGDFQTLSERADILVKVQERLRKLFKRDILIEWNAGRLRISFARMKSEAQPYSSGREASGLLHLVGILSALYDDEVGALLIDEPEVSLHPQLQAFLLKEIISCAGLPTNGKKLVVVATHSTEFIRINRPEDLSSLVFAYDLVDAPIQIDPAAGELKGKAMGGLVARLGQEHKLALFARRPLLVEGASDLIIAAGIATKLSVHLEAAGAQLLPVVGKGQLPVVAKLMRLMGKEPVVLADADGIADGTELLNAFLAANPDADTTANSLGSRTAVDLAGRVYSDFCKHVDGDWDSIRPIAERHYYWIKRDEAKPVAQAKRRAAFSTLFQPDTDRWLKEDKSRKEWISIRDRLAVVLDLSESLGLFFLRQGAIELYYQHADRLASAGKPSAAVTELEWIERSDSAEIVSTYADVVRCLRFAADAEEISEAEALRDILLAVAAPAQAKLYRGTTNQELKVMTRSILGDRSEIFDLSLDVDTLIIKLRSQILEVSGFPIKIKKEDNIGSIVSSALKLDA